jgi:hypothetical protein
MTSVKGEEGAMLFRLGFFDTVRRREKTIMVQCGRHTDETGLRKRAPLFNRIKMARMQHIKSSGYDTNGLK